MRKNNAISQYSSEKSNSQTTKELITNEIASLRAVDWVKVRIIRKVVRSSIRTTTKLILTTSYPFL